VHKIVAELTLSLAAVQTFQDFSVFRAHYCRFKGYLGERQQIADASATWMKSGLFPEHRDRPCEER